VRDDVDDGIDSAASIGLGQFCVSGNGFDQFSFVHEWFLVKTGELCQFCSVFLRSERLVLIFNA
jgi:hypothetical protein